MGVLGTFVRLAISGAILALLISCTLLKVELPNADCPPCPDEPCKKAVSAELVKV